MWGEERERGGRGKKRQKIAALRGDVSTGYHREGASRAESSPVPPSARDEEARRMHSGRRWTHVVCVMVAGLPAPQPAY